VVGFRQVGEEEEVLIITNRGRLIRMPAAQVSKIGRVTQGVKLMALDEGEQVMDLAVSAEPEEAREETES
jgi:DNA gyrase subunit A